MGAEIVESAPRKPVFQFSVFADNKVGRLNDFVRCLSSHSIHAVALSVLDTTECNIVRMVVDDPERLNQLLSEIGHSFSITEVLAVELANLDSLGTILAGLTTAEINIHYLYPFILRPGGKSALVIHLEDVDLAAAVLSATGIKVLQQNDISR